MKNNKELYIKLVFWTLWTALVAMCTYYIIHNAQWLIGDDAIVIRHTGFGKAFLPSDTVSPSSGRFYPFAYLVYDILLLFGGDHISPTAHYVLQAVLFVLFVVSVTCLTLVVLENQKAIWKYSISLMVAVVFIGRVYPQYTECFSTAWFGYSVLAVFMLCVYLFYKKQKWIYGIIALLCISYNCYCVESAFVLPLSFGMCSFLFQRKTQTSKEKVFNWCLVGSALLFLVLYSALILPYIKSAYDSAHGTDVGYVENAVKMIWAQKLLLLALVIFVIRLVDMLRNKRKYTIYDNLLMTAAACCFGNFMLRLNWTLYYNSAALLVIPPILYFSIHYLKEKWTLVLFVLLALFYGRKIPTTIQKNQEDRFGVARDVDALSERIDAVSAVYWYAPKPNEGSYGMVLDEWMYVSLCTYLGWLKYDSEFAIPREKDFRAKENTIWLKYVGNEQLNTADNCLEENGELIFDSSCIKGFYINHTE